MRKYLLYASIVAAALSVDPTWALGGVIRQSAPLTLTESGKSYFAVQAPAQPSQTAAAIAKWEARKAAEEAARAAEAARLAEAAALAAAQAKNEPIAPKRSSGNPRPKKTASAPTASPPASVPTMSRDELIAAKQRKAEQILAGFINANPILAGTVVYVRDCPNNWQGCAYYTKGVILVDPDHTASLRDIIWHECLHIIDWREDGDIDNNDYHI